MFSDKFYQDSVDMLRGTFTKLRLVMDGIPWIRFKDKVFEKWACKFWDTDNDGGITYEEGSVAQGLYIYNINEWGEEFLGYFNSAEIFDYSKLYCYAKATGMIGSNARELYIGKINSSNPRITTGYRGYEGHKTLEIVDIGPSVNWIERLTFNGCTALREVVFNDSLLAIDGAAFHGCINLEKVSPLPDTCYRIYGDYNGGMFYNCKKLKSFTIGRGMQRIGGECFENCTAMESFYIKTKVPPVLDNKSAFNNNPCTIYVPIGCGDAYRSATNWSAWASRIHEYDFNND